jgi:AcrR family transcriptional regulator
MNQPTKAARTRQQIIEKTAPLFNSKGYAATSISDILELTGLTKGSIYGNFNSKDEIVEEAFTYNADKLGAAMNHYIARHATAKEKLMAIIDFYSDAWRCVTINGGCPLMNAATEADDNLTFLKTQVRNRFGKLHNTITQILNKGIQHGEFEKNIDSGEYATLIISLIEGGILLSRVYNSKKKFDIALDRIRKIIREEILR